MGMIVLLAVLLFASVGPSHAWGGTHGFGGHHGFRGHHRFFGPQVFVGIAPYWYYCDNPPGYYPYVPQCPSGWRPVAPTPP
jgi:hypothetical protein